MENQRGQQPKLLNTVLLVTVTAILCGGILMIFDGPIAHGAVAHIIGGTIAGLALHYLKMPKLSHIMLCVTVTAILCRGILMIFDGPIAHGAVAHIIGGTIVGLALRHPKIMLRVAVTATLCGGVLMLLNGLLAHGAITHIIDGTIVEPVLQYLREVIATLSEAILTLLDGPIAHDTATHVIGGTIVELVLQYLRVEMH